ncbi:MAG: hypothetical protein KA354_24590 [Phycisphaerae bacterium]|nr:hypothetical protein [Phycisphaerae bacterium]
MSKLMISVGAMYRRRHGASGPSNIWIVLVPTFLSLWCLGGAQCGSTLETVKLSALEVATVNTLDDDNNYDAVYCTDLIPYGAFEGLEFGAARVGYDRHHDPGTEPLPCWWWVSSVDRGLVRFDLALLGVTGDQITDATLEYDLETTYSVAGTATNCPNSILSSIWIVNEPWSDKFDLDAEFLTDPSPSPSCVDTHHSLNVSSVVRDWLKGVRPNYGFLFVGGDESRPSNQRREHTTTLSHIELKVLVATPITP